MIRNKEVKNKSIIIIYTTVFFLVWIYYTLYLKNVFSSNSILNIIINNTIKYTIWTVPVFIILRYVYKESPITYLKLNKNIIRGIIYGVVLGSIIIVYHVIRNFIMGNGTFEFNIDLYTWVHRIILIGITEEVVFRGFILQKLQEEIKFKYANAISSVLFVLIHFPKWYQSGILSYDQLLYFAMSIVFTFGFGLLQGYILKRVNSLWACMIIHSLNNLITTIVKV